MGENISENNNTLELKSIADIKDKEFIIPSFQRGYRWDIVQVEDLLSDIKEYIDNKDNNKSFLCLQPIVVYKKDKKYAIIDGQQRLTTIAIIKHFLKMNDRYSIEYEKNNKILDILLNDITYTHDRLEKEIHAIVRDNIKSRQTHLLDEYHIILSYLVIAKYFNENNYYDDFKELFQSLDDNYSIQFIWYDVTNEINSDDKKAIDIFTRLNIGKIPLTDAELIKALFLKKDNFKDSEIDKKLHIAYKWDEIEKTLNNDNFWYFISNRNEDEIEKRNRIELILELAAGKNNGKNHELFKEYENKLKEKNKLDELWQQIEECFMTLKEWYNDNEKYHYAGFLLNSKLESIENIYKCDNIKNKVIEKLQTRINKDIDKLNNYNFYDNKEQIKLILFFSNIYETILSNNAVTNENNNTTTIIHRFPFDLYIKENFDVEHIAPQTENPLNHKEERIKWFKDSYEYLEKIDFSNIEDDEIKNNLTEEHFKKMIENEDNKNINNIIFNNEKWNIVYNYILETAIEKGKNINLEDEEQLLGNLVLLPRDINRSYKNALFGIKRKHIIDDETKNCRFIPVVTRHAFLKYYSKNTMDLWTKEDAEQFKEKIINNLKKFLGINKEA